MLAPNDEADYSKRWRDEYDNNRVASDRFMGDFIAFKKRNPNTIRVVFSREPQVKTLSSTLKKIEEKRRTRPAYSYDDLPDIIAITALCPYWSDVSDLISWMKRTFQVLTPDEEALKEYESGHRAFHYVISVGRQTVVAHPNLRNIKCEVQIKTILAEALDAKTHDLTYKPGRREVGEPLKKQFALLSSSLKVIDDQSEFLKDLILREEKELELRREACVLLYLRQEETLSVGRDLGIDLNALGPETVRETAETMRTAVVKGTEITKHFCKFAALCALKLDDEYLRGEALEYAGKCFDALPKDADSYFFLGSIKWALGDFGVAIGHFVEGIKLAEGDEKVMGKLKNNLVYCISDWKAIQGGENAQWEKLASEYVAELERKKDENESYSDTVGYYRIVFGRTASDIEAGRNLLRDSSRNREKDTMYQSFFRLHEYIAIKQLLRLISSEKPELTP